MPERFVFWNCKKAILKTLLSLTPVYPGGRIRSRWGCIHKMLAVSSFLHNSRIIWRERRRKGVPLARIICLHEVWRYCEAFKMFAFLQHLDLTWDPLTHFGSQSKKQFASLLRIEQVWNCCRHQRHKLIKLFIIKNLSPLSHLPHGCRKQPQGRYQQP